MPATWGSAAGLLLAYGESFLPAPLRIGFWGVLFLLTIRTLWWHTPLPSSDPPWIVADEIIGVLAIGCLHPLETLQELVSAFVLFRFWDIVKLWPAEQVENLKPPWGILLDDMVAAFYTCLCLWLS
ncbi:MAG: phosphatidylglycerophosphatase A [Bacteroidia bacterium]|nr:phosphatidylglycerophosphatase A [Bacteroidia bacterium]MDW8134763.1 phosphatidylglycerophosphatase A [Bacteroidia bacterium]